MATIPEKKGPQGQSTTFDVQRGTYVYVDGVDEVLYEYDEAKKAWFPSFDEHIVGNQQSIYGEAVEIDAREELVERQRALKQRKKEALRKEPRPNSSVYVTGLPDDAVEVEIAEYFSKCGVLMMDLTTGDPRVKLYRNERGEFQGDALVTYFKPESVQLAIQLLDESQFRPDDSNAKFKQNDLLPREKRPMRDKVEAKIVQKRYKALESKLEWDEHQEEEHRPKSDRFQKTVVLKHMFTLDELEESPELLLDLKEDIREECSKLGDVVNLTLYDKSEEGVCTVRFKEAISAIACVKLMNGRYFGGRRVKAYIYDGSEKFARSKSGGNIEDDQRLEKFSQWIETEES